MLVLLPVAARLGAPASADAHPLHTTLAELAYDERTHLVHVTVRVFADDFAALAQNGASPAVLPTTDGSAAALARVVAAITVLDRAGRRLPMHCRAARRTGDLLWLYLDAPAPAGLGGARIGNRLLVDRYADQVNIVQVVVGGVRHTLLFTRDDGVKPLP
jgi:hypothetical protein